MKVWFIEVPCEVQSTQYCSVLPHKSGWRRYSTSASGWLGRILCGNKSSWQISHAVLAVAPICCAKRHTLFLEVLVIASHVAPTPTSIRTNALRLRSCHVYHIHFLFLPTVNNSEYSVSRRYNTNRKLSTTPALRSKTKTTRSAKCFDNKRFLIRRIRRHLITQFRVANSNKQFRRFLERSAKVPQNCVQ
jgi:hypothetical protein